MTTQDFALKIAKFIRANNIDTSRHSMAEIIDGYMAAQDKMYAGIEKTLATTL